LLTDTIAEQRDYDIGVANQENVQRFLSSLAIYPFTERLGYVSQDLNACEYSNILYSMTIGDVHLLVAQARQEAADPGFKVRRVD
jgi:hypothetical protein